MRRSVGGRRAAGWFDAASESGEEQSSRRPGQRQRREKHMPSAPTTRAAVSAEKRAAALTTAMGWWPAVSARPLQRRWLHSLARAVARAIPSAVVPCSSPVRPLAGNRAPQQRHSSQRRRRQPDEVHGLDDHPLPADTAQQDAYVPPRQSWQSTGGGTGQVGCTARASEKKPLPSSRSKRPYSGMRHSRQVLMHPVEV
jgi:hypothetical protein